MLEVTNWISRRTEIPAPVRHEGKRTLLNFLGCALGGSRDPAIERALAVLRPLSGPPQASLLGRAERLDMLSAAFLNAAASNAHDFDDTHLATVIHPAAPVAPVVLALSEKKKISGAELLSALIVGIELECRVGNALTPWHYSRGWHITSTCGAIGAAAAASRLLGLDAQQAQWAIGLAANQAAGLVESLGSMGKSLSVGSAARSGLFAALLAQQGFTAAPRTLEAFLRIFGDAPRPEAITEGLGERWESARNICKPYPCGVVLHPVIDLLLGLRKQIDAAAVERVVVTGNPLLRQRTDRRNPRSGREAQVSLQHAVGVCLVYGAAGLAEFSDARSAEPSVRAFGDKVEIIDDAARPIEAVEVAIRMRDGRALTDRTTEARTMSDAELEAKVRSLAAFGAPRCDAPRLIAAAWAVESLADAAELVRLGCA